MNTRANLNSALRIGVVGFLGLFMALFVVIGIRGVVPEITAPVLDVSPAFFSTDSQLFGTLGVPRASEKLAAALETIPEKRPILFIGNDSAASMMTYLSILSISWPRQVELVEADKDGHLKLAEGLSPAAIFFYAMAPPPRWTGGQVFGPMTLVRLGANK